MSRRFQTPGLPLLVAILGFVAVACGSDAGTAASDPTTPSRDEGSQPTPAGPDDVREPTLTLSLGGDNTLSSCMRFDVGLLADMSPAFAATAAAVDGDTVTLTIDHWYSEGDAATARLQAPAGMQALIDGFEFQAGQRYLITATDGTVNYCGYSGQASPELTAAFEEAFAS